MDIEDKRTDMSLTDHFDYHVVGAGLFGSTFDRLATDARKRCLVIEVRDHVGGNLCTCMEHTSSKLKRMRSWIS